MIAGSVFIAVLIIVIVGAELATGVTGKETDTSEGLAIIREAESADAAAIETKIQKLEAKENTEEGGALSLKERFASVVIIGNSVTGGFL